MTRTVESLTDDEIVDAIASFGLSGVEWTPGLDTGVGDVLAMLNTNASESNCRALRGRVVAMRDDAGGYRLRWCDGYECFMVTLSSTEWAKRLAGRTAAEIKIILDGAS